MRINIFKLFFNFLILSISIGSSAAERETSLDVTLDSPNFHGLFQSAPYRFSLSENFVCVSGSGFGWFERTKSADEIQNFQRTFRMQRNRNFRIVNCSSAFLYQNFNDFDDSYVFLERLFSRFHSLETPSCNSPAVVSAAKLGIRAERLPELIPLLKSVNCNDFYFALLTEFSFDELAQHLGPDFNYNLSSLSRRHGNIPFPLTYQRMMTLLDNIQTMISRNIPGARDLPNQIVTLTKSSILVGGSLIHFIRTYSDDEFATWVQRLYALTGKNSLVQIYPVAEVLTALTNGFHYSPDGRSPITDRKINLILSSDLPLSTKKQNHTPAYNAFCSTNPDHFQDMDFQMPEALRSNFHFQARKLGLISQENEDIIYFMNILEGNGVPGNEYKPSPSAICHASHRFYFKIVNFSYRPNQLAQAYSLYPSLRPAMNEIFNNWLNFEKARPVWHDLLNRRIGEITNAQ